MRSFCRLFTLYKHRNSNGSSTWHVRYWNEDLKKYSINRSTGIQVEGKKERRAEAEKAAVMLLQRMQTAPTVTDQPFVDYCESFWMQDSPYVKERALLYKRPLSKYYVIMSNRDIRNHVKPYPQFKNLSLHDLKSGMIRDWMVWAASKGLGPRRINACLQAMRIPWRYLMDREEIDRDPFLRIKPAHFEVKEKGILTPAEVISLIAAKHEDPRARLCIFLGALCGLRRGEVRGLLWGDVDLEGKVIHVRHNYIDADGLKMPKNGTGRDVPIASAVSEALKAVRDSSPYRDFDDYVVFSDGKRHVPVGETFIQYRLEAMLQAIGIPNEVRKSRNITFHSLRHSFVTLGRLSGINDMVIQALAGHKSAAMMQRYTHAAQVIDMKAARERLEKVVNQ